MNISASSAVRIMIVEDEALVRQDLEEFLIELGYKIAATADTGEDAISQALAVEPDLIFMDVNLKGSLDGIEAAKRISEKMFVPVIYLTAFSDEKTQDRIKSTSPFGYVLKPFDERELRTGIELALQRSYYERELEERRQWYETTLRSIDDGVVTTDTNSRITYLNPAAERLINVSLDEVRGRDVREVLVFTHEINGEPIENPVASALKNRRTIYLPPSSLLVRFDGEKIPVSDSAALLLDERDNPLGVVAVFQDTSEQRRLTKQLVEAKKMEAIGILAGGVAHNFNNMMTAVMCNLELALMSKTSEGVKRHIDNANTACQKAADLTQKLLSFARGQILRSEKVDLNRVVLEIQALGLSLTKSIVSFELKLTDKPINVRLDAVNLEQAILNLCINSIAAMPEGGTLTIETESIRFDGTQVDASGTLIPCGVYGGVGVADTGMGMNEETMAQIFEPFFTTKLDLNGTGLGLSSVQGFVKQSGGYITITSKPGRGTRIYLYFPQVDF